MLANVAGPYKVMYVVVHVQPIVDHTDGLVGAVSTEVSSEHVRVVIPHDVVTQTMRCIDVGVEF